MELCRSSIVALLFCASAVCALGCGEDAQSTNNEVAPFDLTDATSRPSGLVSGHATMRIHYPAEGPSMTALVELGPDAHMDLPCMASGEVGVCQVNVDVFPDDGKSVVVQPHFDEKPSRGPRYVLTDGETVDIFPHFVKTEGKLVELLPAFHSNALGNDRTIWAYLPASYDENSLARYPVLYMHDGKNLFDPAKSNTGVEWQVDETVEYGWETTGQFAEFIVIGIQQVNRRDEYTPVFDASVSVNSGQGDLYMKLLMEELKPQVDAMLRTLPDAAHTATMGSSLGGLISVYAGLKRPDVFGRIGAMSPSTWVGGNWIVGQLDQSMVGPNQGGLDLIYLDKGASESNAIFPLVNEYRKAGYEDGEQLWTVVEVGGTHTESAWARRLPAALGFLFPDRRVP